MPEAAEKRPQEVPRRYDDDGEDDDEASTVTITTTTTTTAGQAQLGTRRAAGDREQFCEQAAEGGP